MPLQLSEFTDLLLLFIILEPCHYNFKILQNMPLHIPSTCFSKFIDQNTPRLPLPLIPSLFPLSPRQIPTATNSSAERHLGASAARATGRLRTFADRLGVATPTSPAAIPTTSRERGGGGASAEGGARRGSCAAARPVACPGWISPSRHGRPPGRIEGLRREERRRASTAAAPSHPPCCADAPAEKGERGR